MTPETEFKKMLKNSFSIPGLYRRNEARFLYKLARRKGRFVELGCWMGRTTSIILQAASIWGASLTTVDAFSEMPGDRTRATVAKWEKNLRSLGLVPPTLMAMTTDEAHELYPVSDELSFLFIDANHEYNYALRDLKQWTSRLKVGGTVALHDMFYPSIKGVCSAVVDWWTSEFDDQGAIWEPLGQVDFTVAFKRKR